MPDLQELYQSIILDHNRRPKNYGALDEATVRRELEGNLCRCTGYHNIVKAILAAAPAMKSAGV